MAEPEVAARVASIILLVSPLSDRLVWIYSLNGTLSAKQAFAFLHLVAAPLHWANLIWKFCILLSHSYASKDAHGWEPSKSWMLDSLRLFPLYVCGREFSPSFLPVPVCYRVVVVAWLLPRWSSQITYMFVVAIVHT